MRIDTLYIKSFKNLQEFSIDFNEKHMNTVLLGQNATGKSNLIEALILIFKYLDLKKHPDLKKYPDFDYDIKYNCRGRNIEIKHTKGKYLFIVSGVPLKSEKNFFDKLSDYLPKYVFTYYSGISNRLKDHFDDHQRRFYDKLIKADTKKEDVEELRRLFYVQLIHSYFVLMAFYSFEEEDTKTFLEKYLRIEDLESILFVMHTPNWAKGEKKKERPFWGAKGLVQEFLAKLWDNTLAPIYHTESVKIDFRSSTTKEFLYLYVKDKANLKALSKYYNNNTDFFKALESTYISDLIEEVRVKVHKRNVKGEITFRDLSEGEQQLLTVLGLLKFTKDEESLILLDEPDTHLNPLWKWEYLELLEKVVGRPETTQIIINTHDPLVIGGLSKEEVRVFRTDSEGKIYTEEPDIDPKGLGVAGILTSELFGLPTTLDKETQRKLDEKNTLLYKQQKEELNETEKDRLRELFDELNQLGFTKTFRDPLYQKFLIALSQRPEFQRPKLTAEELQQQNTLAIEILDEILKDEEKL